MAAISASSVLSVRERINLVEFLKDAFFTKMIGEELLSEDEEDFAEYFSDKLAKKIVNDRGEEIKLTVYEAMSSPEEYKSWNITTWVIADWALAQNSNGQTNPVNLKKEDEEGTHESWKQWIVGVETPYYILKENNNYTISRDLDTISKNGAFTVTWINAGTVDQPKEEAHMITVIDKQYYDTASLRDEDNGFHDLMTRKGYKRNEIISPYENFCTIWSWLFVVKIPSHSEKGWEQDYAKELFKKPNVVPPPRKKRRTKLHVTFTPKLRF